MKGFRIIPAILLLAALLLGGYSLANAGQRSVEAQVEAVLVETIASSWPWRPGQIQVSNLVLPADTSIPQGAQVAVRLPASRRPLGRLPFQLVIGTPDGEVRLWASARVEVMLDVLVSKRPLMRHQILMPEDLGTARIALSKAPVDRLPTDTVRSLRAAVRIPAGRPITRRMVEAIPVIHRGDRVTLLAQGPGLRITAQGEAREDGAPEGAIQVLNLTSRRMVQGRVLDAGTVEVGF